MVLGLVFSALVGISHYISNRFHLLKSKRRESIISFIAGISLTYLLLVLLPEFYERSLLSSKLILLFILAGFSFFHLVDKFIYQKVEHSRVRKDIRIAHGAGIAAYYFVVGAVLFSLFSINIKQGILFFIPVALYAIMSNIYAVGVRGIRSKEIFSLNLIQSIMPLAGAATMKIFPISETIITALIGIVAGMFILIIVKDVIPKDTKGKPADFVLGAVLYILVIIISWLA